MEETPRKVIPLARRVLRRLSNNDWEPRLNPLIEITTALDEIDDAAMQTENSEEYMEKALVPLRETLERFIKNNELVRICSSLVPRVNGGLTIARDSDRVISVREVGVIREILKEILNSGVNDSGAQELKRALGILRQDTIRLFRAIWFGPKEENGGKVFYRKWVSGRNGIPVQQGCPFTFSGLASELRPTRTLQKRDGGQETITDYRINRTTAKQTYLTILELAKKERESGEFLEGKSTPGEIEAAIFLHALPDGLKKDPDVPEKYWTDSVPSVFLDEETKNNLGLSRPSARQ